MTRDRTSVLPRHMLAAFAGLLLSACGVYEDPASPYLSAEEPGAQVLPLSAEVVSNYDLGSALGSPVTVSNTCGAFNQYTPICASSSASDHSYWWTAPRSGTFSITTSGSTFNTVLQILDETGTTSLGCNDNTGFKSYSSVSVSLIAGQRITIVVDGYGSACGSFKLSISEQPTQPTRCIAETQCSNGWMLFCEGTPGTCNVWPGKAIICNGEGTACPCTISCVGNTSCDSFCGTGLGRCSTVAENGSSCGGKYCWCARLL